jgi:hypothetical protein
MKHRYSMGTGLGANMAVGCIALLLYALLHAHDAWNTQLQPSWPGGAVTAVLVATTGDELGWQRLPFLLASLCQQMAAPGLLEELLVVTPDQDVKTVTAALVVAPNQTLVGSAWERGGCRSPWPVRVVPDSAVLPTARTTLSALTAMPERPERGGRGVGYRLQMLIKLGVAKRKSAERQQSVH